MHFIGIITKDKNENILKKILVQKIKCENLIIININEKNINNIKNIKFQIILLIENTIKKQEQIEILKYILLNSKILIVDADFEKNLKVIENIETSIITYGFNSKSSITISSVSHDKIILFIQRNFQTLKMKKMECKEINIDIKQSKMDKLDINTIMGIYCIMLLYK